MHSSQRYLGVFCVYLFLLILLKELEYRYCRTSLSQLHRSSKHLYLEHKFFVTISSAMTSLVALACEAQEQKEQTAAEASSVVVANKVTEYLIKLSMIPLIS